MPARTSIVEGALYDANWDHWRPIDEEMKLIFVEAGLDAPTAAELKKFGSATSNIWYGGKSVAWCGIFAAYVLSYWGGLDVRWVMSSGLTGAVKPVYDHRGMRPGDVAVIRNKAIEIGGKTGYLHHHYIITKIDYEANRCSYVEGNGEGNRIWWRTGRPIDQANSSANFLKRPYCYYQLVA